MRLFLAIAVDPAVRASLGRAVDSLRESRAAVRWVKTDAIHQTIKFLGETPEGRLGDLINSITSVCGGMMPFQMSVAGLGAFPDLRRPRVVWAGVEEPSGTLRRLWMETDRRMRTLGWPVEKKGFRPHITLGRVKGSINISRLGDAIRSLDNEHWGSQDVDGMALYQSRLTPGGAEYEIIHVFPFGKT